MTRRTEYLTHSENYRLVQQQVLNALETHPEMWVDGNEYQIVNLVATVRRAISILYALRKQESDTHGLGGAGALELAQKIDKYVTA